MPRKEIHVPEGELARLHFAPDQFSPERRLAAAVKWYASGKVSQSRTAEIAGLSRTQFIDALSRFQVSSFQISVNELCDEVVHEYHLGTNCLACHCPCEGRIASSVAVLKNTAERRLIAQ